MNFYYQRQDTVLNPYNELNIQRSKYIILDRLNNGRLFNLPIIKDSHLTQSEIIITNGFYKIIMFKKYITTRHDRSIHINNYTHIYRTIYNPHIQDFQKFAGPKLINIMKQPIPLGKIKISRRYVYLLN